MADKTVQVAMQQAATQSREEAAPQRSPPSAPPSTAVRRHRIARRSVTKLLLLRTDMQCTLNKNAEMLLVCAVVTPSLACAFPKCQSSNRLREAPGADWRQHQADPAMNNNLVQVGVQGLVFETLLLLTYP